jgi:cardiolipin synthase (CMP-forming)
MSIKFWEMWLQKLPAHERRLTVPTALTLGRIGLGSILIGTILAQCWMCSLVLLICAAITDILDGYLARLFDDQTLLGALLDPLADKLLTIGSFLALMYIHRIPCWFFVLTVIKECLQLCGAGSFLYRFYGMVTIQATWLGKAAMVGQTVLIGWVILDSMAGLMLPRIVEYGLLWGVSMIMMASLLYYIVIGLYYYMGVQYE